MHALVQIEKRTSIVRFGRLAVLHGEDEEELTGAVGAGARSRSSSKNTTLNSAILDRAGGAGPSSEVRLPQKSIQLAPHGIRRLDDAVGAEDKGDLGREVTKRSKLARRWNNGVQTLRSSPSQRRPAEAQLKYVVGMGGMSVSGVVYVLLALGRQEPEYKKQKYKKFLETGLQTQTS